MKKLLVVISLLVLAVMIVPVAPLTASTSPTVTFLNPPHNGVLVLEVGETVTLDVEVTSDEPFILVMAMGDEYYPGRGIYYYGNDIVNHDTYALLQLTMTGKQSTAELPDGVAPVAVVAGVRYPGGVVFSERFDFNVLVP